MRKVVAVVLSSVAVLSFAVSPALGAPAKIVFGLGDEYEGGMRLGDSCVAGRAPASVPLHLVWRNAAGAAKANVYLATSDQGTWGYCSSDGATLAAGDLLKATVGSYTRKFVVPLVTIVVDRVRDNFRGRAPAESAVTLWYVYTGCCPDFVEHEDLTADSDGKWLFSNYGYPVNRYEAHVEWRSALGDSMSAFDIAPSVTVTIGRSVVFGSSHIASDQVKVVLRDGVTDAWKAVARTSAVDEYGSFRAVFVDPAGNPVNVSPGDRVVGVSLASDMHFIVGDVQASADVATDVVTGRCGNRPGDQISVYRSGNQIGYSALLDTDDQGYFSVWFGDEETLGYDPANIRHGDRIEVVCGTPHEDHIAKRFVVP